MRTVFVGTSPFAAAVLDRLIATRHRPLLVVSRPDRPRGRGRQAGSPAVVEAARRSGIDTLQPERAEEATEQIESIAPEVVCVCAYGALIREPLLSRFELLNVHPSLLPRWRGAAPIERAIMAGDTETGVSIMRVTAGLDSGPVCARATEPIGDDDTYGKLAERLQALGADLLIGSLDSPARAYVAQDDQQATYAEKLTPADRLLDPERSPQELARVVRALNPHVGAWVGDRLRVHAARPTSTTTAPGELAESDGRLLYGTRGGGLELLRVQPPGGREMDAAAYLRGHDV